jgi:NADPH-dependent glutamate synthase beta subunit-like oxidoreductase
MLGDGTVAGIELKRCVSVFDEDGRFNPTYDDSTVTTIEADRVIIAIGQSLDKQFISSVGIETERGCSGQTCYAKHL